MQNRLLHILFSHSLKRFALAFGLGVFLLQPMFAQDLSSQRSKTVEELKILQSEISLSEQRKQQLASEINALEKDRETLNRTLIETSQNSRNIEDRITKAEMRLSQLRDEQADVRVFLNSKKALLTEVLGALQRMGRNPPPALLVSPEDALSSVRSAICTHAN